MHPNINPNAEANLSSSPRVALTLKVSKLDYVRLTKLRLKELEAGHDLTHQEILYDALKIHLRKRGV